jgi:NADH-ubiquinone oxidoreductase chain 5
VGDLGYLMGVCGVFVVCQTIDFSALSVLAPFYAEACPVFKMTPWGAVYYFDVICFAFFVGVVGKSAQVGLHTWLPAAMEGPTPVSALIHAATMVTAGIFLLIRCSFLFECSTNVKMLVVIFGVLTAGLSAFTALFLYDMKRIIAYSTCSQLGYMAVACGLSQYTLGLFHLINHAFFKALLFLTAGAIIHSFQNEQDIRKLHSLSSRAPFLHSCILVGSVAIMGLPFLSGFYSKDLIIELVYIQTTYVCGGSFFFYYCILGATLCTGLYSVRLYYYLFLRAGVSQAVLGPLEQPVFMRVSLSLLMFGSIFSGYVFSEIFSLTTP